MFILDESKSDDFINHKNVEDLEYIKQQTEEFKVNQLRRNKEIEKMKIVFLDVDGVLNGYSKFTGKLYWCFKRLHILKLVHKYYDLFGVSTHKVRLLAKIIHKTGAKVVISSSWRHGWYTPYEKKYKDQRQLEDKLKRFNIEVIGITPSAPDGHRESEITEWLSECKENVDSFVILDDESFDLQGFVGKELVKTSKVKEGEMIKGAWYENTGLKRKHVKQAIKLLNGGR